MSSGREPDSSVKRRNQICGDVDQPLRGTNNPTLRGNQRIERDEEVRNLKRAMLVSAESGCGFCGEIPWGATGTVNWSNRQSARGDGRVGSTDTAEGKKPWRGKSSRGLPTEQPG
jgi:hypothetical protein